MRASFVLWALLGALASLGHAEEAAWKTVARGLPNNIDDFLLAAHAGDLTPEDEATIHALLARACYERNLFEDAYRHAESGLALTPPTLDAGPVELALRRLCSEAALRSGRIERAESHAVRLGLASGRGTVQGHMALADALDRLMEASRARGALLEASAMGEAIRGAAIEDGTRIFAPLPLIRYASLLVDLGQFVPALRVLDEVDAALPGDGADRERGLSMLARTRASRRMGNPRGAETQMHAARKFIQLLDDRELFARLALEEVLARIEQQPSDPAAAAKWGQAYLERRRDDMEPDKFWDRRLWTMLGVARDFAGDHDGALEAWRIGVVGHEQDGPRSMTEARGYLSCAAYLHEDRREEDAAVIARRADFFLAQFAQSQHGRAGLGFSAEVRRRIAQAQRDEEGAADFERRDASGDAQAKEYAAQATKAIEAGRPDDAERLLLRAFDCAPWSDDVAKQMLWFLLQTRRVEAMRQFADAARVAGHSGAALFAAGLVDLGAHDADGAVAKLGRLTLTRSPAPRSPRFPLGLGAMLVGEPGIALRVLGEDPGWKDGEWEIEEARRSSAMRWMAQAQLALDQPDKARRLLRRPEASSMDLASVQEIEWLAAYSVGNLKEAQRHVGLLIQGPETKVQIEPRRFRAVLEMELGQWQQALADWEAILDEQSQGVAVAGAWLCASAAGNPESRKRWADRLRERNTRWAGLVSGESDAASLHRTLVHASLAGERGLAWDFFLLGLARRNAGDREGAASSLRQAIARTRDEVAVRAAARRLLNP